MARFPQRDHEAFLRLSDGTVWEPDACTGVTVSNDYTITDHPIEDGAPATDHIQRQPGVVTLSLVLTESPPANSGRTGGVIGVRQQLDRLKAEADAGTLVDIVLRRLGVLRRYAIQSLPVPIDGVARLAFDLTLRQVRIATSTSVEITVDQVAEDVAVGAPDEVDAGEQSTTDTSDDPAAEEEDQSILAGIVDLF